MRRARIAAFSLLGIVAVVAIAIIVALTIDLGRYKSLTEKIVSNALGRQFTIDGTFEPTLGKSIRVTAGDIRLAGPDWSLGNDLLFVTHIDVSIQTWSLIRGPIRIESLTISGVTIDLEKTADGQNNWHLGAAGDAPDEAQSRPVERLPVFIEELQISDFALVYTAPTLQQPLRVSIKDARETILDSQDLHLAVSGSVNDTPLSLSVTAGKIENLLELEDVSVNIDSSLGEISMQGSASIDNLLLPSRPTGQLVIRGPNAEYLTDVFGIDSITSGPLDLNISITPQGQRLNGAVQGIFGEFIVDADGSFVDLQHLNDFQIRTDASGPNAGAIGRLMGVDTIPDEAFRVLADTKVAGTNVEIESMKLEIGDTRFDATGRIADFPRPQGASLTLSVSGPEFGHFNRLLGMPGKLTGSFELDAIVKDLPDNKASVTVDAVGADLAFSIKGVVVDADEFEGTTLELTARGPDFSTVAAAGGLSQAPSKAFDLQMSVVKTAAGVSLSNGSFRIGNDKLGLTGAVGGEDLHRGTDLQFEISGPDLAGTLAAFGRDARKLPSDRWSIAGRVYGESESFVVQNLLVNIGANAEYRLRGDGRVTGAPGLLGSKATIDFTGSSLGALAAAAGVADVPDDPFNFAASIERVAGGTRVTGATMALGSDEIRIDGLIGDEPLQRATDFQFQIAMQNLRATLANFGVSHEKVPPGALMAGGRIRHRGKTVALERVSVSLGGANLAVNGFLGMAPSMDGTDIEFNLSGDDLSKLLPEGGAYAAITDAYRANGRLRLFDGLLSVNELDAGIGQATLNGKVSASFDPLGARGAFDLKAGAADFSHLVPRLSQYVPSAKAKVPMTLRVAGKWDEKFWEFDDFLFTLAEGRLTVKGAFDGPPSFEKTDLVVDLHIAHANTLSALAGWDLPDQPVTMHSHFIGDGHDMSLQDFNARVGDSVIEGKFMLRDAEVPKVSIQAASERLDLSKFLPPPQDPVEEIPAASADKLIPDRPLPLDRLRRLDADVDVTIGQLDLRLSSARDIRLVAELEAGALEIEDFQFTGPRGGQMSGRLRLKPDGTRADMLLNLHGSKQIFGLPAKTPEDVAALPEYDIDWVLQGSGATTAELAGSLNGFVRVVSGPGRVRSTAAGFFTQDFLTEILSTINPFAKTDPYTNIKCVAVLFKADNGILSGKPALVAQTDKLNAFAEARINLKTEGIDLAFNMVPQKGLGFGLADLVTPYTKVGGTLANPNFGLDSQGALVEGGAAVATAGLSILAKRFVERYLSAKDACGKAVADTEKEFSALQDRYLVN